MTTGLEQIKKSVQENKKDEIISEFLIDLINEHVNGIWGFKDKYMKKIDNYVTKWDDPDEN